MLDSGSAGGVFEPWQTGWLKVLRTHLSMLPQLIELGQAEGMDPQWRETQTQANAFIGPALDAYFSQNGIAPFPEAGKP